VCLAIDEFTAMRMINLIAGGESLIAEFIERMPTTLRGKHERSYRSSRGLLLVRSRPETLCHPRG